MINVIVIMLHIIQFVLKIHRHLFLLVMLVVKKLWYCFFTFSIFFNVFIFFFFSFFPNESISSVFSAFSPAFFQFFTQLTHFFDFFYVGNPIFSAFSSRKKSRKISPTGGQLRKKVGGKRRNIGVEKTKIFKV